MVWQFVNGMEGTLSPSSYVPSGIAQEVKDVIPLDADLTMEAP